MSDQTAIIQRDEVPLVAVKAYTRLAAQAGMIRGIVERQKVQHNDSPSEVA